MKTIMAALDFSEATERVLSVAADLAKTAGGSLYLLHVEAPDPEFVGYEPGPQHVRNQVARAIAEDRHEITALRDRLKGEGIDAHCIVLQGPTIEKIADEAVRLHADCVVVGSHGHGALHHLVLGSVSAGLIRRAACPVLVVPRGRE